jgi:putative salt-induced outer membrane protein YdiY
MPIFAPAAISEPLESFRDPSLTEEAVLMSISMPSIAAMVGRVGRDGVVLLVACLALGGTSQAAEKTDVVTFANGDRLTGEIKSLEQGKLKFKTDAAGTIEIEWDKIATLQTNQYLQVELASGLRYFGKVPEPSDPGKFRLAVDEETKGWELQMAQTVRIAAIDQGGLIARLDGYVTGGYDYTKANNQQHYTLTGGVNSRDQVRKWSIDGSATVTTQQEIPDSRRYDLSAGYRHFLAERWFLQGFAGIEGNDELGLNMRATLGAAYGRYLMQTQTQEWSAYVGVAVTREDFGTESNRESVEGVLGTQYSLFRYNSPEASLDAVLNVLPSFTESGRVRTEAKLRSRYEIVTDFFFEIDVYSSYDSKPDENAESNNDYGVVTSLGYSF